MITSRAVRRFGGAALAVLVALAPATPVRADAEASTPTLWGVVPEMVRSAATQVVNEKVGGERVGTLPAPADGRFVFANLAAGDYVVRLVDSTGQTVAQSRVAQVQPATATQAQFDDQMAPVPVVPAGSSNTLLIAAAAAAAGVGIGLLIDSDDPRPASPSR